MIHLNEEAIKGQIRNRYRAAWGGKIINDPNRSGVGTSFSDGKYLVDDRADALVVGLLTPAMQAGVPIPVFRN